MEQMTGNTLFLSGGGGRGGGEARIDGVGESGEGRGLDESKDRSFFGGKKGRKGKQILSLTSLVLLIFSTCKC